MIRVRRLFSGVFIYVGPWAMRFTRPSRGGTYSNGSHWHSPLYRWQEDDEAGMAPPVCPKCGTAGCIEDANSGWYS